MSDIIYTTLKPKKGELEYIYVVGDQLDIDMIDEGYNVSNPCIKILGRSVELSVEKAKEISSKYFADYGFFMNNTLYLAF